MVVTSISRSSHYGVWLWEGFEDNITNVGRIFLIPKKEQGRGQADWLVVKAGVTGRARLSRLSFICLISSIQNEQQNIKHSNKVFLFSFHTSSPSLNLWMVLGFWVRHGKASDFPEQCICNIKLNILSFSCGNSFIWLKNFWSVVVLKFRFGLIILNFFYSVLTSLLLIEVSSVRLLKRVNIPPLQFFFSFAERLILCKIDKWVKSSGRSPLCWMHIRRLLELVCVKLMVIF